MGSTTNNIDYDTFSLLLNEKQFKLKQVENVSARALTHWRQRGLLEDHSKTFVSGKTVFFSALEIVWISIISDLRDMGVETSSIAKIRVGLFSNIKAANKKEYPALLYYMLEIIERNVSIYIVLTDKNDILMLNDLVYHAELKAGTIENHIAVSLNKQIRESLEEIAAIPNSSEFTGLSMEEIQVLQIVRNKTFKYITITKKDGNITKLESIEQITDKPRIEDILKAGDYQNLEIKQHNGKVVCINRTLRKKIKK